jgi:hypothetical protein
MLGTGYLLGIIIIFIPAVKEWRRRTAPRVQIVPDPATATSAADRGLIFSSLIAMINNEGVVMWSRYNAMLTGNTIVGVLLAAIVANGNWTFTKGCLVIAICLFGLGLSWQWRGLAKRGFEIQHSWVGYAKTFQWSGLENPLLIYSQWALRTSGGEGLKDWFAIYARRVVWLFLIGYSLVFLSSLLITFLPLIAGLFTR